MIALTLISVVVATREYHKDFVEFMTEHEKTYDAHEFKLRFETFKSNVDFIDTHNNNPERTFDMAINLFADLTSAEFTAIYNGVQYVHDPQKADLPWPEALLGANVPVSVDWRTQGAVTHVKNQGRCGSCWSFSTTGSTEGQHFLSGQGELVSLSEQNLMDCSWAEGNNACQGGLMDNAFRYIVQNDGIDTEASYPYEMQSSHDCRYKESSRGACISRFEDIPSGNEEALTAATAAIGPISVAIDASHRSFQFYHSGVYYEPQCSSRQLDHGVLVVGYGTENGEAFYWVKNSWSAQWGDQGYLKMSRNRDNNCGIATQASYPVIDKHLKCQGGHSGPSPTPSPTPWW